MHVQNCCFANLNELLFDVLVVVAVVAHDGHDNEKKNPIRIARTDLGTSLHVASALRLFLTFFGERRETGEW